jgi:hypothetical protein
MLRPLQPPRTHSQAVVSQRRLDANRDNAKKSTGRPTHEGKRRSALNATRHGILSQVLHPPKMNSKRISSSRPNCAPKLFATSADTSALPVRNIAHIVTFGAGASGRHRTTGLLAIRRSRTGSSRMSRMIPRLELLRSQILGSRRKAGCLDERLPAGTKSLRRAAWARLQDSVPRATLLSIHARVEGTSSTSWEHPSLVQLWGPRFNDYVVAAKDLPIFSLGRLPEDASRLARASGSQPLAGDRNNLRFATV